jgi:hypothetical protein
LYPWILGSMHLEASSSEAGQRDEGGKRGGKEDEDEKK